MTTFRATIPDFQLANPLYAGALVSFYTVDGNGEATTTLATLYADPTGTTTVNNPQTLDGFGKFSAPVYIAVPVIASVVGPNVPSHTTGVINPRGVWRGNWAAHTVYYSTDFVFDPISGNTYAAVTDFTSSSSIATDIAAGNLTLIVGLTDLQLSPIDVFAIGGQSNAVGTSGDPTLSPRVPTGQVLQYYNGVISDANDPVGNAVFASPWPEFGLTYFAATGRRVLLVPSAVGGTDQCATTGVSSQNWDLGGTLAPALVANVTAAMAAARAAGYSPTYRGIEWSQGENDAGAIGNQTTFQGSGVTTVTGGPYAAGATSLTIASATGVFTNQFAVINLDGGNSTFTSLISVSGTTITLTTPVPIGHTVQTGAPFHIFSQSDYRAGLQNMINYFRTTTTDGTTFPQLPFYISQTGGPSTGDTLGYQKVRQAQDQVAQSDPHTKIVFRGAVDFIARGMMQSGLHYLQEGYNEMGREMAKGVVAAQDGWLHQTEKVYRVALGGALRNGDALDIVVTSTAITSSPWTITTTVILPGDTWASFAARLINNATVYSPNLMAAGLHIGVATTSSGAVFTFYQPTTLSPQATVTASWTTGGATETAAVTTGTSAYGQSGNLYYDRGTVTVGAPSGGIDTLNVFQANPGVGPLGAYAPGAVGSDLNVLRLANTINASTYDQRVGVVFQPAFGSLGTAYGGAIISQQDQITGRTNIMVGGYAAAVWAETARFGYNGGLVVGSALAGTVLEANGGSVGPGTLALGNNVAAGADNYLLYLINRNGNTADQRVGIVFASSNLGLPPAANSYGRTIYAAADTVTGRHPLHIGGWSNGVYADHLVIDRSGNIQLSQYTTGVLQTDGSGNVTAATISVPNGGTGQTSFNAHGVLLGEGSSALSATATPAKGTILYCGTAATDPSFVTQPVLGNPGTTQGALGIAASGGNFAVTFGVDSATASYNFTVPTSAGTAGKPLLSNAGGTMTWGTLGAAAGGTGVANNAASTLTISGSFGTTITVGATTAVTLPASGTLAGKENANTWSAIQTIQIAALGGAAPTNANDGLILQNLTAAAAGAQQNSPNIRLSGQGWKTTATAASQQVDWNIAVQPVQSTTNPSSLLIFGSQVNGLGFTTVLSVSSAGGTLAAGVAIGTAASAGPTGGTSLSITNNTGAGQFNMKYDNSGLGILFNQTSSGGPFVVNQQANSYLEFDTNNASAIRIQASGGMSIGGGVISTDPGSGGLVAGVAIGIGTNATSAAFLQLAVGTTAKAQIAFGSTGVAPTSPNNGDFWFDGTNLNIRIAGSTKTITHS